MTKAQAEGHLVSVSRPSMNASFVYDGDGARVESNINRLAILFRVILADEGEK